MSSFDEALPTLLLHEGRYADRPDDPGGPTQYGISLKWLAKLGVGPDGYKLGDLDHDGDVDADDIRLMTVEKAATLYRSQWWERYNYATVNHQGIATKLLDLAVNMGPHWAHVCLQRALWSTGHRVVEDGVLGPVTVEAVNLVAGDALLAAYRSEAAGYYRSLHRPSDEPGWLARAYS